MQKMVWPLAIAVLCSGCYSWHEVKPTELPKLNNAGMAAVSENVVVASVARLERPDGTLLEVTGSVDVRITELSGKEKDFDAPVESSYEGFDLTIRSENLPETRFRLSDVEKAEVSIYSGWQTALLAIGGILAPAAIIGLIAAGG